MHGETETLETHAAAEDFAMGLELEAIELESQLEWAEAQGRDDDVQQLKEQLGSVFVRLADVAEEIADAHPAESSYAAA